MCGKHLFKPKCYRNAIISDEISINISQSNNFGIKIHFCFVDNENKIVGKNQPSARADRRAERTVINVSLMYGQGAFDSIISPGAFA